MCFDIAADRLDKRNVKERVSYGLAVVTYDDPEIVLSPDDHLLPGRRAAGPDRR
jgi:hypothetical protein